VKKSKAREVLKPATSEYTSLYNNREVIALELRLGRPVHRGFFRLKPLRQREAPFWSPLIQNRNTPNYPISKES